MAGLHQEGLPEISVMTDDEGEEPVREPRERSRCRGFLNWLRGDKKKVPTQKRTTKTYLKEATDEHLISSSESF